MRRPNSIFGLTARLFRAQWAKLSGPMKIGLVAALFVGSLALVGFGRCLLAGSCPASATSPCSTQAAAEKSPCPYSSGSAAMDRAEAGESPCGR